MDKRGRKLGASHTADQLKHFYRLKSPDPDADDPAAADGKPFVDYARGEGNLDSSGSEDEESDVEEEELELGPRKAMGMSQFLKQAASDDDDSDSEGSHLDVNLSEDDGEEEDTAPSAFPPERDDGEEEEDEEEEQYADPTKRIAAVNLDWDNMRAGDLFTVFNSFLKPTGRNGESSTNIGKLLSVKIYPSEFGKERLEREEREGPGGGTFVSKRGDEERSRGVKKGGQSRLDAEDSDDEEDGEGESGEPDFEEIDEDEYENEVYEPSDDEEAAEGLDGLEIDEGDMSDDDEEEDDSEFDSHEEDAPRGRREIDGLEVLSDVESNAGSDDIDMDVLRQYQLERLRYWYAIATFSTVEASMKVLSECNGAEFEKTANMLDLSYVPDEMEFDQSDIK